MEVGAILNTFFGAGFGSVLVYYLAMYVDPLVATIIWTIPFTMIFPIYNLYYAKKTNSFISKFLRTQTYSMFLLVIFLYASAYFIEHAKPNDGIVLPMLKGGGVWTCFAIVYYAIVKNLSL